MNTLFTLIIYPLKFLIEFAFSLFFHVFKKPGIAILGVSLAVTLMCLPLYIIAEKWQDIERNTQKKLAAGIKRIKQAFKGDEQFMILTTYYKQNHYHPLMALRSSFSLLIQVPFFMAAYSYLSHLTLLQGQSFFFVKDMGAPDAMFTIGNFSINILPIVMTLINCASGFIYSKGHSLREKLQIYIMAAIFLVILYDSPSGLVIYWTCNQIFSFLKNVFMRFKKPLRVLYACMVAAILFVDFYVIFIHQGSMRRRMSMAIVVSIFLFVPLFVKAINYLVDNVFSQLLKDKKQRFAIFITTAISLSLLHGFVIPGSIIASSVIEFSNIDNLGSPVVFIINSLMQSCGLFIFWPLCIYLTFGDKAKTLISVTFVIGLVAALLNTFVFIGNYGTLTRLITFSDSIAGKSSAIYMAVNIIAVAVIFVAVCLLIRYNHTKIISGITSVTMLASFAAGIAYIFGINNDFAEIAAVPEAEQKNELKPVLHLSKTGKNVVLFMLDRAENAFFDSIFDEEKSLNDIYSGFTLYPNTLSYGGHTIIGAPPLFGGYEYTPNEFNKRSDVKKIDKHNEAILLLPRIFSETAGYKVTVSDTSWANYSWIADMSVYNGYKNVTPLTLEATYTSLWMQQNPDKVRKNMISTAINRNMLYLSLFRSSPIVFRDLIYDDGLWWNTDTSSGDMQEFLDYYSELDYLPELTDFTEEGNTFFSITNDSTHANFELNPPEYVPSVKITQKGSGKYSDVAGYSSNIAAFKLVGDWIKYLKENDVYDNTRIIIVSDHGIGKSEVLGDYYGEFNDDFNRDHLHPMLFVKDFNAKGAIKKDYTFMTNADVPLIALKDIVENPVNPFTGKKLNDDIKKTQGAIVTTNSTWSPDQHGPYTFKIGDDEWYTVKDNIFDSSNWVKGKKN